MNKAAKAKSREIRNIRDIEDKDIDLSDIAEVREWSNSITGKFYRPVKKQITIRIDADVIAWLKEEGRGYQTRINGILRNAMQGKRF